METISKNLESKFVGSNDKEFYSLVLLYKRLSGINISDSFLYTSKAFVLINQDKELIGGFFVNENDDDDCLGQIEINFKRQIIGKGGVYITGLCIDPYFKNDAKMIRFMEAKIETIKRSGQDLVWGVVTEKWLIDKYREKGYELHKLPNTQNEVYFVRF